MPLQESRIRLPPIENRLHLRGLPAQQRMMRPAQKSKASAFISDMYTPWKLPFFTGYVSFREGIAQLFVLFFSGGGGGVTNWVEHVYEWFSIITNVLSAIPLYMIPACGVLPLPPPPMWWPCPHYPLLQWLYGGRLVALKVSWQK